MKRCNTNNHEGARHRRKPLGRRNMGFEISTVIIIYIICFAFTHSNIDFQKEYQEPCIHFQNVFRNGLSFSECDSFLKGEFIFKCEKM